MLEIKFFVTTALKGSQSAERAKQLAKEINITYIPRNKKSLDTLINEHNANGALVVTASEVFYTDGIEIFKYHPSIAKIRIKALKNGKTDQMVKSMDLKKGMSVLDCTLGLGADAVVASYITGPPGKVTGLESIAVISVVIKSGLQIYKGGGKELTEAMRRVQVINEDHLRFLKNSLDNSYDIVYFDPMFRTPQTRSPAIKPLRHLADQQPLSNEAVKEGLRVARRRVILKEARKSNEFARLGFERIEGGKNSFVAYGIIEKTLGYNRSYCHG